MTSGPSRDTNLSTAERLLHRAAEAGAGFVAFPENFARMATEGVVIPDAESLDGPIVGWGRQKARELNVDLLLGSIPERAPRSGLRRNTSVLVDRTGRIAAVYRKIHLFDVCLDGRTLEESSAVEAGRELAWGDLEWGRVGLSVCYDLRFPEIYRALRFSGAELLTVPSAFTARTGPDHWHLLLRARAVENQAFVVAPAQVGRHGPTRESYGHALIVDPWGEILADAGGDGEGLALAELDPDRLQRAGQQVPCLEHAKSWLRRGKSREEK
ncbi:MAG: carbon-nitrogen hydrolase family protein [Acidobacteriota bacterium]|nr:MAG: carbon-nitrogen hydrolase family protein [Acidobacteriota bacterium]